MPGSLSSGLGLEDFRILGLRFWDLGFRVWDLWIRVSDLGFSFFCLRSFGFRV